MAILKLKYNLTPFADLSAAKAGVAEKMVNAQVGEFWAGEYEGGAVLAFKGANGVVVFSDAAAISAELTQALTSYYTKEEVDAILTNYYTKAEVDAAVKVAKDAADAAQDAADKAQGEVDALEEVVAEHVADTDVHIQEGERAAWNKAKSDIDAFLGTAVSEQEAVIDTLKEIQDFLSTEEGGTVKEMLDKIQSAQDAADAAQGEVDALEEVVANHKQEFESFKTTNAEAIAAAQKAGEDAAAAVAGDLEAHEEEFAEFKEANTQAIADAQTAAEKVATDAKAEIDAYTVNGYAISANPVLVASDLAVTPNDKLEATNVQTALEELQSEIAAAVAGGINTIVAGDAISVDATDSNNPTVAVKVDASSIVVVEDKLAVELIDCGTYEI